jgi:glycosyltransferase involved in cell wall biosynthesis
MFQELPLVSVIIPNYNYANFVCESIDSVLSQTYKNIEIIVVDDGSEDNSKEILKNYGNQIKVVFQKNAGVSAARNNGVKESKGDYLAFLDSDDIWLPEKIEKQVEVFQKKTNLGIVHVGVKEIDGEGNAIETKLDGLSGWHSHELLLFSRSVVLGGGSGFMVSRKVFDEVEGFDLRLLTSADWDLFYRISCHYQIEFVSEVLMKYRIHISNMHGNIARMEREMLLAFEKAFSEKSEKVQKIKRDAYSNLYKVLAGSYFHVGQYMNFARTAVKSIYLKPSNLLYFVLFPKRVVQRNLNQPKQNSL